MMGNFSLENTLTKRSDRMDKKTIPEGTRGTTFALISWQSGDLSVAGTVPYYSARSTEVGINHRIADAC